MRWTTRVSLLRLISTSKDATGESGSAMAAKKPTRSKSSFYEKRYVSQRDARERCELERGKTDGCLGRLDADRHPSSSQTALA